MQSIVSLVSGLIFGFGLIISGMTQPGKVIGFLDFSLLSTGGWQWDLMGVMGGALGVHAITRYFVIKRAEPLFGGQFPTFSLQVDRRLLIGAALFGLGWGTAGICPGPALVSLATGDMSIVVFVVMMAIGMFAAKKVND